MFKSRRSTKELSSDCHEFEQTGWVDVKHFASQGTMLNTNFWR